MRELRPYQYYCIDAIKDKYENGVLKQLACMATGTGKTALFVNVKKYLGLEGRVMILAHRDELLDQASARVNEWLPESTVSKEKASEYASDDAEFVVASVQTLGREGSTRINSFNPFDFCLLVVDESHHAINQSYKKVIKHFRQNPKLLVLGVTATPMRSDGAGLNQVFDEIVYSYGVIDAIKDGWLARIKGWSVSTMVDLSSMSSQDGDFVVSELSKKVNIPERNALLVKKWKEIAGTKKTLAFAVDIQHAKDLADAFKAANVSAEAVWGVDPNRDAKLSGFKEGKIQVLCNAQLYTEGTDIPQIECVVLARPTKSKSLHIQMVGRGLRLFPGKDICIVIDAVDNCGRHDLVTLNTTFDLPTKVDLNGRDILVAKEEYEKLLEDNPQVDLSDAQCKFEDLKAKAEEIDVMSIRYPEELDDLTEMQWHKSGEDHYVLRVPMLGYAEVYKTLLGYRTESHLSGLSYSHETRTLEDALALSDRLMRSLGQRAMSTIRRSSKAPWLLKPATEKQKAYLRSLLLAKKKKLPNLEKITKGEAMKLINKYNQ